MPILKAINHRSASKDAVVLDLGDLGRQAAKLRAMAEAKAQGILQQARDEAARLTAGATETGDARGYAEGLERGRLEGLTLGQDQAHQAHAETLQHLQQRWTDALGEYEARFLRCEQEARTAALQLAVKLAEKVIHRAVASNASTVVDQVAAALSFVLEPAMVKVRVHPDDRETLTQAMPALLETLDRVTHADMIPDDHVGRGGCVVTCGPATIDARIDVQLQRLASLMLGESAAPTDTAGSPKVAHDIELNDHETCDPEPS